jgi:hypothetical protein
MGDVDCIGLAQDRNRWRVLVNLVLNLRVPSNSGSLSSSAQFHRVNYTLKYDPQANFTNKTQKGVKISAHYKYLLQKDISVYKYSKLLQDTTFQILPHIEQFVAKGSNDGV